MFMFIKVFLYDYVNHIRSYLNEFLRYINNKVIIKVFIIIIQGLFHPLLNNQALRFTARR